VSDYDTLMDAVSKAREESRTADRVAREARKRVVEAERAFVDWMVEQNAARPAERVFAERISERAARPAAQEGRDDSK